MLPGPECPCGCSTLSLLRQYSAPPAGESRSPQTSYEREIWHCPTCGHYVNRHALDMDTYYAGAYTEATYGRHMRSTFERIVGLPSESSDNAGRVDRVLALSQTHGAANQKHIVLDVGSGLCVFLHRLQQKTNWTCLALDPDAQAVKHARQVAKVSALQGNFLTDDVEKALAHNALPTRFSVITLNKVLEHVMQPAVMLNKARNLLSKDGIIYMELPDGECAAQENTGLDREEFHLEHWHMFSMVSACLLAHKAGLTVRHAERLREPSGKYTLWLCATKQNLHLADEM